MMPTHIKYTLCSEGPSDRVLMRHIDWALERLTGLPFSGEWADPSVFDDMRRDVAGRVAQAVVYYPCNLLFVHRDADGAGFEARKAEITASLREAGVGIPTVPVVPVRMTESWLLCDEAAIRRAAGCPLGRAELPLPSARAIEADANPKQTLEACLSAASERSGRKLEIFKRDIPSLKYRIAELVEDFEPLVRAAAFSGFMADLEAALDENRMR